MSEEVIDMGIEIDEPSTDFGDPTKQVDLDEEEEDKIDDIKTIEESPFVLKTELGKKDNKYFYYVDADGNICKKPRKFRKGKKRLTTFKDEFVQANLTIPKIIINGWCSNKFKIVRKTGERGAYVWVPPTLIGKEFMVILIPKEDWIVNQLI